MKISADDQKGIGVILLYTALLFFLIGMAGHMKADFHYRAEIFTGGLTTAAVLAAFGVIMLIVAGRRKRG
jgi:hypothetical protein